MEGTHSAQHYSAQHAVVASPTQYSDPDNDVAMHPGNASSSPSCSSAGPSADCRSTSPRVHPPHINCKAESASSPEDELPQASGKSSKDRAKAAAKIAKTRFQGRFSGRLKSKEDEKKLAEECRLLGPYLGGVGQRGNRSHQTLAQIVRGIASGEVRDYCEQRERRIKSLKTKLAAVDQTAHSELQSKVKEVQSENTLLRAELELKTLRLLELEKERQQKHLVSLSDERARQRTEKGPGPLVNVDVALTAEQILRGLQGSVAQPQTTVINGDRQVSEHLLRALASSSAQQHLHLNYHPYQIVDSAPQAPTTQQLELVRFVPQLAPTQHPLMGQDVLNYQTGLTSPPGLNLASLSNLGHNTYTIQLPISYLQVQAQGNDAQWQPQRS